MKKIGLIVARDAYGVIGKDNDIPWSRLKDDMAFFKNTTIGNPVIMGRKNWISIPERYRPLPERTNIIMTREKSWDPGHADACVVHSLWDALARAEEAPGDTIWFIGGGEIYTLAVNHLKIDQLYITDIKATFEGNVYCPALGEQKGFLMTSQERFDVSERNKYPFTISKYFRDE